MSDSPIYIIYALLKEHCERDGLADYEENGGRDQNIFTEQSTVFAIRDTKHYARVH